MTHDQSKRGDPAMADDGITRRDFLNGALIACGGLLLNGASPLQLLGQEEWTGYGGAGDYSSSNGNTFEVATAGHAIRDRTYLKQLATALDTREHYDCVIVGGGISGLAAALLLQRQRPSAKCLVIDNHPIFGGEAKRNEFDVDGQRLMVHQGSALFFPPSPDTYFDQFYRSIGIDWRSFRYQEWSGSAPRMELGTDPYPTGGPNAGLFFGPKFGSKQGTWVIDPCRKNLEGAPISPHAREELLKAQSSGNQTRRKVPKQHGDAASRRLDQITLEQDIMEKHGISRDTVRTFMVSAGGGSGLGPDALSAYADYAADLIFPWDQAQGAQMFPGGNTGIARHMIKSLIPNAIPGAANLTAICQRPVDFAALDRRGQNVRVRLRATVVRVAHDGPAERANTVTVTYSIRGKLYKVHARSVIMAGGNWTTKHIVSDLPAQHRSAYEQFHRSPCLMMNVALRNWRFLYKLGISECEWYEGLGNYTAVRRVATFGGGPATIHPDSPTVLTIKILYPRPGLPIQEQVTQGRWEMMSTSFTEYERRLREQFTAMFSRSGFDARKDIAAIILNRWGHAYLSPQPGFFFGTPTRPAPGEVLRKNPFGRIAFANSDLSGIMDHRASIVEAERAVSQVIACLGSPECRSAS